MLFWAHYDRPLQEQQEPLALVCGIEIWLLVSICCILSGLSKLKVMSQTDSIVLLLELELAQAEEGSSHLLLIQIKWDYLSKDQPLAEEEFKKSVMNVELDKNDFKNWKKMLFQTDFRRLNATQTSDYWSSLAIECFFQQGVVNGNSLKFKIDAEDNLHCDVYGYLHNE
ncbi:hypothetical protein G6F56_001139 [Rhizopus delemar]|nr:hypothetical protein G6F56_001139 [Rhizopus delemar]